MKLPSAMQAPSINVPSAQGLISGLKQQQQQKAVLLGSSLGVATGAVTKVVQERNEQQNNAAYSKVTGVMNDYDLGTAGKEFYSGDEVPEDIDVKRTETIVDKDNNEIEVLRERIPSYEVDSQIRDSRMRKAISTAAADIDSPSRRKSFTTQMTEMADKQNLKSVEHSRKMQTNQIRTTQDAELDKALLDRDYEAASYTANNFNGSDSERAARTHKVRYMREFDTYNQSMSEESIPAMTRSIDKLEDPDYRGELNEVQRLSTLNQLRSKVSQVGTKKTGQIKASSVQLGMDVDRATKAMENGEPISPSEVSRLVASIESGIEAGTVKGDAWERRIIEFNEMNTFAPELAEMRMMDNTKRAEKLTEMRANAKTGGDQFKIDVFETVDKKATKMLADDPLQYAQNVGLVDVEPLDLNNMGDSLRKRQTAAVAADGHFGKQTHTGLFTNEEAADVIEFLDGASDEEQMRFISQIVGQVPDSAGAVWSQLMGVDGGTYAVMGDLLQDNQVKSVKTIMTGRSAVKETPEVVAKWKTDMEPVMLDAIGNSYSASPETRGAITENIKYAYAGLSIRDRDLSGEFNSDRMGKAIAQVTGGVIKIGGNTVPLPERGMSADYFDSWIRDIDPIYFAAKGGADGYNSRSGGRALKGKIRDGSVAMQAIGKGQYALFDVEKNGYLQREDNKEMYIFEYDENADQLSRWERGAKVIEEWWDE